MIFRFTTQLRLGNLFCFRVFFSLVFFSLVLLLLCVVLPPLWPGNFLSIIYLIFFPLSRKANSLNHLLSALSLSPGLLLFARFVDDSKELCIDMCIMMSGVLLRNEKNPRKMGHQLFIFHLCDCYYCCWCSFHFHSNGNCWNWVRLLIVSIVYGAATAQHNTMRQHLHWRRIFRHYKMMSFLGDYLSKICWGNKYM